MREAEQCVADLEKTVDDLRGAGMGTLFILCALAEMCVKVVKDEQARDAATYLESAAAILDSNAHAIRAGLPQ